MWDETGVLGPKRLHDGLDCQVLYLTDHDPLDVYRDLTRPSGPDA